MALAIRKERERERRRAIRLLTPVVLLVYKRLTSALEQVGLSPAELKAVPGHVGRMRERLRDAALAGQPRLASAEGLRLLRATAAPATLEEWRQASELVRSLLARSEPVFPFDEREVGRRRQLELDNLEPVESRN